MTNKNISIFAQNIADEFRNCRDIFTLNFVERDIYNSDDNAMYITVNVISADKYQSENVNQMLFDYFEALSDKMQRVDDVLSRDMLHCIVNEDENKKEHLAISLPKF